MPGAIDDKEIPKDLGVKIGTPEEAFWTDVKNKCDEMIKQCKHEEEIQGVLSKYADKKIEAEKGKV